MSLFFCGYFLYLGNCYTLKLSLKIPLQRSLAPALKAKTSRSFHFLIIVKAFPAKMTFQYRLQAANFFEERF